MAKIITDKNTSKKEVIIQKAASLFRTKSYTASSMRELADLVGVEAPSLYNHIGAKSEILQAICIKIAETFTQQVEHIRNSEASMPAKIEAVIRFHIEMMAVHFDEMYVADHEWKHLEDPHLANFLGFRRQYEKSLQQFIETGIERNEIRNLNPYVAVLTILSAVRGLEFWQRNKKNISLQVVENDMINHLLNGIIH